MQLVVVASSKDGVVKLVVGIGTEVIAIDGSKFCRLVAKSDEDVDCRSRWSYWATAVYVGVVVVSLLLVVAVVARSAIVRESDEGGDSIGRNIVVARMGGISCFEAANVGSNLETKDESVGGGGGVR
jgi:hypothetical protein